MRYRKELEEGVVEGEWWHADADGRVVCELCPRRCRLQDGQHGFCFVREARQGRIVLSSYGRSTGFCVDPIEKKPLNHFFPGTSVLSFGTAGCNLGCRFCQNWNISKARTADQLSSIAYPEMIAEKAARSGCQSIAFTYNDPVIFAEYAIDTAKAAHELDLKAVVVSAGYISTEARSAFFEHVDAANIDLKAFTPGFYKRICLADLEPVLDTLMWIRNETDVWLEVTTLLIPEHNDAEDEISRLCDWFVQHLGPEVPLHFTAFHPDFKMLDIPHTPAVTLTRAREQAISAGLKYVYTGNIFGADGQSTFCSGCGKLLIERDMYSLGTWNLTSNGRCSGCGTVLAGHFDAKPGQWGRRRQPLFW